MKEDFPLPDERVNVTPSHPLKEAALLSAALVGIILIVGLILELSSDHLIPLIPFSAEQSLLQEHHDLFPDDDAAIRNALQALADNLAAHGNFPANMPVTIHYASSDTINAGATLGGHIIIFRGLLQRIPHENALAMVLAHEMAHVKHRHPLRAAGRGITLSLLLAMFGIAGSDLPANLAGSASFMQSMHYSRAYERESDATALAMVKSYYGHTDGAADLFRLLADEEKKQGKEEGPLWAFMRSHPITEQRTQAASSTSNQHRITPLPQTLQLKLSSPSQSDS